MELSVTFPSQPTNKHSLKVLKKVGQGKFSVFHTQCPTTRKNYALKVFPDDAFGTNQYQKESLIANLSHPNIIQHIPATISSPDNIKFHTILTEFVKHGDFFEIVVGGALNSEIIIRTYFHQLIAGIEYLHSQKIAHLDLKLENLMMSSDYTLKIIDFDQAQKTTDEKLTSAGTKGFRAPEVLDGSCEDLCAADIYSAGVILYAFRAQEYPFAETGVGNTTTLKHYSTFNKNNKAFWDLKAAQLKDSALFGESFKEIVNGMLDSDAVVRFNIEDIKKTEWYNGPILDSKSLQTEVKRRFENFKK